MKVFAPAKLILSGEHAVVHGCPALAVAIDRYATTTVTRQSLPNILFELSDLAHRSQFSLSKLKNLRSRLKTKYKRFVHGDINIKEVVQQPHELAQFALSLLTDQKDFRLPHGAKLHLESDIPIGCGMGSSAATILSVLYAISLYYELALSHEELFNLALQAENLQHGNASGLDVQVSMRGGCHYFQGGQWYSRLSPGTSLYLINSGTPESATGECVMQAAEHFQSEALCEEFSSVTEAFDLAFQSESYRELRDVIQHNHQLLRNIGVVPDKVSQFVSQIENQVGGAAKICGAGAVRGDRAGAVLVLCNDEAALAKICRTYQFDFGPLTIDTRGLHVI